MSRFNIALDAIASALDPIRPDTSDSALYATALALDLRPYEIDGARATPDPYLGGIWSVGGFTGDLSDRIATVYLAGYRDRDGRLRGAERVELSLEPVSDRRPAPTSLCIPDPKK